MNTRLKDRMAEKGYKTDAMLAAAVGCHQSMISRIKHGKAKPALELTVRICEALDLPPSALLPPDEKDAAA